MACNMIPICCICLYEFNESSVVPLILGCNHTYCKLCITKLSLLNIECPKCNDYIPKNVNELPVNISMVLVPRPDIKCQSSALQILKLYLSLLNQPEDDVAKDVEETEDSVDSKQIKNGLNPTNIRVIDYWKTQGFFQSVYGKVLSGEKIYTCRWRSNEKKYGKISIHENMVFFHSMDLLEIPSNSQIIMFRIIKQNLSVRKFYTFIKLSCKKNTSSLAIIEMLRNNRSGLVNHFIHYCTGEDGQSYKNFVQVGVSNDDRCDRSNECVKLLHVIPKPGVSIYDRKIEGDYEEGILRNKLPIVPNDTVFVEHLYMKGWFSLVSSVAKPEEKNFVGRVISPVNLFELLDHDDVPKVKILDSGLSVRI